MSTKLSRLGITMLLTMLALFNLNMFFMAEPNAQGFNDPFEYDYDYDYDGGYDYTYTTDDPAVVLAAMLPMIICSCLFGLVFWVYYAVSLSKIATKTGHSDKKVYAWIPIANNYLETQIAGKPAWWLLLYLVPFVNLYIYITVWMGIAKAAKHPTWIAFLNLLPFVNFAVPGYVAFVEGKEVGTTTQTTV